MCEYVGMCIGKSRTEMSMKFIKWIDAGDSRMKRLKLHYCMSHFMYVYYYYYVALTYICLQLRIHFHFAHHSFRFVWFDAAAGLSMAYFPISIDWNLIYMQNELIVKWKWCYWCRCVAIAVATVDKVIALLNLQFALARQNAICFCPKKVKRN